MNRALVLTATSVLLAPMALGCNHAFYLGDPKTAPFNYGSSRDNAPDDWPLEDQIARHDVTTTMVLDAAPSDPWRPLLDIGAESDNGGLVVGKLKEEAAIHGADAVIHLGTGAGPQQTSQTSDGLTTQIRGVTIGGTASTTTSTTQFGSTGVAIRRAQPGREAYLGIGCKNYIREASAEAILGERGTPYVPRVLGGPAARAGVQSGEFVFGLETSKGLGHPSNCVSLNKAIQEAGPGSFVTLALWRPGAESELTVGVPVPRRTGVLLQEVDHKLVVLETVAGFPAASELLRGDVVESMNGHPVRALDDITAYNAPDAEQQRWDVRRGDAVRSVTLKTKPDPRIVLRQLPDVGVMVALVAPVHGDPRTELQVGDVLLDYETKEAADAAIQAQGEKLRLRVRREGTARLVRLRLDAIPDDWYHEGTGPFVRRVAPPTPPPPAPAAPPAASTAAPPPAAPAGCGKDTDCKGDRVCVKSECVDPKAK